MSQPTCKERVKKEWLDTRKALKKYFDTSDYEGLSEYGLSIDYVSAGTFNGQRRGYVRYQFSWGGPSDELRIYKTGRGIDKVEYWFLDWFDGAKVNVTTDSVALQAAQYAMDVLADQC